MSNLLRSICFLTSACLAVPSYAGQFGQPPPATPPTSGAATLAETTASDKREATNEQKDWHFIGHVEMDRDPQGLSKIYADDVRLYTGQDKAIATGNVLLTQGANRISAERAEFNTKDSLGTFYNAWGMASVKPPVQRPGAGGIAPPPIAGQENVIIFFGEKVEKIGPKKYRITNGGFSTCAQPTPRWDLHAGTVILNVDHYTVLTNAVMNVKGVPMFYLPVLYYPTKRDDRATGFLIPTYGVSSLRGQSLHNAFFWAINRSQDATFMHDWYSKTGQGYTGEYRYNYGLGTDGNLRFHLDDTHEATYPQPDGTVSTINASQTYEIRGAANQLLPGGLRARANANYFSDINASQAFNTNIYDVSRNNRTFGGNVVGAWSGYMLNATVDHSEYFNSTSATQTTSSISGNWPRLTLQRAERPIGGTPAYFSLSGDYSNFLRQSKNTTTAADGSTTDTTIDFGVSRLDFSPQVRYPFKQWAWFTVNNTLGWHQTYYNRTYLIGPDGKSTGVVVDEGLNRPVLTFQAQIVGPVFNRIWDTPDNGYAEKFKHTIEPVLTIDRTSAVDQFPRVVQTDGIDSFVGGARYNYGLNNRFYAKRSLAPGQPAAAREIVDVSISQSYYTNQLQSLFDHQYQTSLLSGNQASNFSPIALSVRAMPTNSFNATMNAEFGPRYHELRTISAQGGFTGVNLQGSVGWSKGQNLDANNNPTTIDQTINGTVNLRTRDNKYGTLYSMSYDVLHGSITTQRITGFYNAQCCGLAMEYQAYNYNGSGISSPIPSDHRFFMSFTLAGLGNFSPFNGALGGVPR